jgi:hypothetical protein
VGVSDFAMRQRTAMALLGMSVLDRCFFRKKTIQRFLPSCNYSPCFHGGALLLTKVLGKSVCRISGES